MPTQIIMVTYHRPNDFTSSVESITNNTLCPYHLSIIDNSKGKIDNVLDKYKHHPHISIYRNDHNLGKGAAVNKWYSHIMRYNQLSHFISIDSDVIVPNGWLLEMQRCFYHTQLMTKVGLIAPVLYNLRHETWDYQLSNKVVMHNTNVIKPAFDIYPGLYYNRSIAGPLLIIDTNLFETTGLFNGKRIYGADDGHLCVTAHKHNAFIGINTNISVQHINEDSDIDYILWKQRNITKDVDQHGRWD